MNDMWPPTVTEAFALRLTAGDEPDSVELGMVVVGDALYVRAFRGPRSQWFRAAVAQGRGHVRIGSLDRDVALSHYTGDPAAVDAAYRAKYGADGTLVDNPVARSATLRIEYAGRTILVDPQLDPAGARDAVPNTPNPRRSPLGELPIPAEQVIEGVDALLVTHLHRDHFDDTARELLPRHLPVFCQPPDTERLHADGFTDVRPVHGDATLDDILIARTEGQHGVGEIGAAMAPVSGFVLAAPAEPTVYIAGDTILCDEVRAAVAEYRPDYIVVNASAAQFNEGGPIVMNNEDVAQLSKEAPDATIVAVHFETVSHSTQTRADLRALNLPNVAVPDDGAALEGAAP